MNVTFLVASARANGNSEQLARHGASALPESIEQHWLVLGDHPLEPFQDLRHGGYAEPTGHAKTLVEATLAADHIVFVAPVYWYSVPAPLKLYLDYWSHWMRVDSLDFKARMAQKVAASHLGSRRACGNSRADDEVTGTMCQHTSA